MKLVDKIKNLFLDELEEEEEDEEEEETFKEKKKVERSKFKEEELPKIMRQSIKKEEPKPKQEEKEIDFDFKSEELVRKPQDVETPHELPKRNNMPIDFEKEFSMDNTKRERVNINVLDTPIDPPKKVAELYAKKEEVAVKPKFKASPVISPVYGVLDKNYTKEEVRERDEEMVEMKRPSKKVDFETVRKKAFGNLADEIKDNLLCENCELYKEVKKISELKEDDLLYDMTVDEEQAPQEVTIEKAYDNYEEFGVAYEPKVEKRVPIINEEDNSDNKLDEVVLDIDKQDDDEKVYNDSLQENDDKKEEEIPSREKKKETKVDEDFFELIDSMYKERVDE